jgi:DNA-3-methyladenine glycosylase I
MPVERVRCTWARTPESIAYHDKEWGRPVRDDRTLFEFLVLEGAQAGLSWETILKKRENYRKAFANFDIARVARFGKADVARLLGDAGIVRNRLKINAAIENAKAALEVQRTHGSLAKYFWGFVGNRPIVNRPASLAGLPVTTPLATEISKELRARGFRFVGPTIVYSFMQAVGLVDDHLAECFRAKRPAAARTKPPAEARTKPLAEGRPKPPAEARASRPRKRT